MKDWKEQIHIVESGDTLYRLSRKYQISLNAVFYANPYLDVYHLQTGDELYIPRAGQIHP